MKRLPDALRFSIILVVLGLLVGGLLPIINEITHPIIERNKLEAVQPMLEEIAPNSEGFKDVTSEFRDRNRNIKMVFVGFTDSSQTTVNAVIYWVEATGYGGGAVETLVAIDVTQDQFLDVIVASAQGQTPGIGDVILGYDFNMSGSSISTNVDNIAGVTVSVNAVRQAVTLASAHYGANKNTIVGLEG